MPIFITITSHYDPGLQLTCHFQIYKLPGLRMLSNEREMRDLGDTRRSNDIVLHRFQSSVLGTTVVGRGRSLIT